ncbi:hypothetical protein COPEUT_01733 [Coprococcus eutactus ATCC 27759]|nr:hypothetical protein COPEUT_01733 [Coprococcus eutactus ATCC 27759]
MYLHKKPPQKYHQKYRYRRVYTKNKVTHYLTTSQIKIFSKYLLTFSPIMHIMQKSV